MSVFQCKHGSPEQLCPKCDPSRQRVSNRIHGRVGRKKFTYRVTGGGVDSDGWWKHSAVRSDGRVVKLKPKRYRELLREGRIESSNEKDHRQERRKIK